MSPVTEKPTPQRKPDEALKEGRNVVQLYFYELVY